MMYKLELELTDYLDSLLVEAGIEPPRKQVPTSKGDGSMRFVTRARSRVRFIISDNKKTKPHFSVTYKEVDCSFSLVDGSPLKSILPPKMQPIFVCIAQMWIDKRDEIKKACKEKMGLTNLDIDENDEDLPCDGMYVAPEHALHARKRPWLEKKRAKEK